MRWDRDYKNPEVINDPTVIPAYGVTDVERAYWNAKQEALEYDRYPTLRSDKHCTSGVIHRALEDYKVQAIEASQAYFNGQVSGLTEAITRCEDAADRAVIAEGNALASETAAADAALSAAASDASAQGYASAADASSGVATAKATAAAGSATDSEAWAAGTRNGTPVETTDPTYHNNAKYYADIMINPIDDSVIDTNTTWSSSKISTELSGKADLVSGKVPAAQLPSYVDDVLEGTAQGVTQTGAGTYSATGFILTGEVSPCTPEAGKTYVDTTTNIQYRWAGSVYVSMGTNLVLGTTATTAYPGDMGNATAAAVTGIAEKIPSDASSSNKLVDRAALDTDLASKSDTGHTHDDRYYTETEIDNLFNGVTFTTDDGDIYMNW